LRCEWWAEIDRDPAVAASGPVTKLSIPPLADEALGAALAAMPIFPLPGVSLFPGALLPLHIFEPRYRTMLADSLATHKCLAMALLLESDGAIEGGQPRIARVAGVGTIAQHELLADGRSNILLKGCARVSLDELPFEAPYRRARARLLEPIETPVSTSEYTGLRGAAIGFAAAARRLHQSVEFDLPLGIDAGTAADLCAHHLILNGAARQHTLEELDVAARVRFVTEMLAEQLARLRPGRGRPD
jgi:Lon protease-like protein